MSKVSEGAVPWREVFPPISREKEPGRMLAAAMDREDVTQEKLAYILGLPVETITQMVNGDLVITESMAKSLGEVLYIDYKVFEERG